jgi:decaprenylphospho-beta-D-erythro-pentofuranosid-2-ulose 2-reductase
VRDGLGRFESLLVLGGTSDIGVATAREAIARGATRVVLAGRDADALEAVAGPLRRPDVDVSTCAFDADDPASHADAVGAAFAGSDIDVVVVAFGVLGDQAKAERDPLEAVRIATTNYVGATSALTVAAEHLRAQGHGDIAVLSSVAGQRVRRSNYVYGASKAGLDRFSQGLADALHPEGIHLLVVRPGFVHTKMTAGMRAAPLATDAASVATALLDGLARRRDIVWVPALFRPIMAILDHLPRALFRRVPM